ncbi:MAG: histidine kinase N-terminal 7TM domain-containing protein [Acutalibacteraceae bacterium]
MKKSKRNSHKTAIIVLVLIICAVVARILSKIGFHNIFFGIIRTMIYIGLYIGWGISVSKRVMQVQVRRCLISVSGLMIFWFVVRTMKYFFVTDIDTMRNLWYWYYFPMLFIPLMSVFVAMSLGKPDNYRLPKWTLLLYIPTMICLLLVLTNDFHQLAFSFPEGEVWSDKNYEYNFGYYFVIGWEIICALLAFVIMVAKCRLSQRKKYLPFLLLLCSVIYAFIYSTGVEWMQLIGGDITAVQCLMFAGILESCIQCGLIQTNSGYGELFEVGTIGSQIVDNNYNIRYSSSNAPKLTQEIMRAAENGAVKLDKNTLLKSSRIDGGRVLWQENITDITAVMERLEENKKTISESNDIEQKNYKTKVKINAVREKNRLYDLLQKKTSHQIELLDDFMTQYESESNPKIRRSLLAKSAVIGAYIKRRGNLMFISEKSEVTDTAELSACLDESFANLELMGVDCAIDIPDKNRIYTVDAIRIYDFFEAVTESAIDDIRSVWLKARISSDFVIFNIETESSADLSELSELADACACEDGVWRFTLRIVKVGEQL